MANRAKKEEEKEQESRTKDRRRREVPDHERNKIMVIDCGGEWGDSSRVATSHFHYFVWAFHIKFATFFMFFGIFQSPIDDQQVPGNYLYLTLHFFHENF